MSRIIDTEFGRFNLVKRDGEDSVLFECPGCGTWATLDGDQLNGRVSVDHAADGCSGGYHETHNYVAAIASQAVWWENVAHRLAQSVGEVLTGDVVARSIVSRG